jgi:hypothetical protein
MFHVYLKLGFDHIFNLKAYDHLLFLVALCAVYAYWEWKRVLVLITAFTIGHSLTLVLSSLDIIHFRQPLIEVLIPVTILLTAIKNLVMKKRNEKVWSPSYLLPLGFGLIHGMGFSGYFKSLLGKEANILLPLFSFNVGVEIGQICIVGIILLTNIIILKGLSVWQGYWNITVSVVAAILACVMIFQRI